MGFVAIWAGGRAGGSRLVKPSLPFSFFTYYQKHEFYIPTFFCFLVRRCLLLNQTYTVLRTGKERNIWPFGEEKKLCFIFPPPPFLRNHPFPWLLRIREKRGAYHNYSARPIHAKSIIVPIVGSEFSRPILIYLANSLPPSSRPLTLFSQT